MLEVHVVLWEVHVVFLVFFLQRIIFSVKSLFYGIVLVSYLHMDVAIASLHVVFCTTNLSGYYLALMRVENVLTIYLSLRLLVPSSTQASYT